MDPRLLPLLPLCTARIDLLHPLCDPFRTRAKLPVISRAFDIPRCYKFFNTVIKGAIFFSLLKKQKQKKIKKQTD